MSLRFKNSRFQVLRVCQLVYYAKTVKWQPTGKKQALVGAILFCGEHPGPRFEDKFQSANQMDGISKAGRDKMAAS